VALAGCAGVHEATGTASQQDLAQIRNDLMSLQLSLQRTRAEIESGVTQGDRRTREQSTETTKQLSALAGRLEALQTSLNALSARTDDLNQRVEALRRAAAARTPSPTPPPPSPSTAPSAAPSPTSPTVSPPVPAAPSSTPPATAAVPPPSPTTSRPTTGALQPQDIYQAAYLDFSKGSYPLAMAGFREFLRRHPTHSLADSAQYWIGEAHVSLARGYANNGQPEKATQELEEAVKEFRKVVANYPRGDKVPTALYKEALALLELKQPAVAQARLQYLVDNFPRAEEAPLARDRLATLKQQ
jgi:tol-pal system protein YbgF